MKLWWHAFTAADMVPLMANHDTLLKLENIVRPMRWALDALLPPRCVECSGKISDHGMLCTRCWGDLTPLSPPFCMRCAVPFEFSVDENAHCASCLKHEPAYDWARAAVAYEALGKSLVLRLKYGKQNAVVPIMTHLMAAAVRGLDSTLVIPVPLHRRRFIGRRFNQSQLVGAALAAKLELPFDAFSLRKHKSNVAQGGLSRKGRARNVKGAFSVPSKRLPAVIGQRILLVDDVLTT